MATVGQVKGSIQLVLAYVAATVIIVAAIAYLIVSSQKKKNPKPGGTPQPQPLSTAGKVGVVLAAVCLAACSVSCAHVERHAIKRYKPYAAFTALS